MAATINPGSGGGGLSAEERARREALRQSLLANAAKYKPAAKPKSATSSSAYDPLSSANTGKPPARKVGTTLAPTAEEITRQRTARPLPVAPPKPAIPTVAARPSATSSAAYDPLSSANTGRPLPRPTQPEATVAPPRLDIPSRGYNYTEGSYTGATPAQRRQEIDWAQMAAQATAQANAMRRAQEEAAIVPGVPRVQAKELPPQTDFSKPANVARWTGQQGEQDAARPTTGNGFFPSDWRTLYISPELVPGLSPGAMQYVQDRDFLRTQPGGDAWTDFARLADAERKRAEEASQYAAGLPATPWEAEQYAQDPTAVRGGLPSTYMPYSEEELRAMAGRPDVFNPFFAYGSRAADLLFSGPNKEVSTEIVAGTERTDAQGNPIPGTGVTVGGGLNIMVDVLAKAAEIGAAGHLLRSQIQIGAPPASLRSAEQQVEELVAAARPEITANIEALRDVNRAVASASVPGVSTAPTGPQQGPRPKPPATFYDWYQDAKRNYGIVPIGPKTLDQTLIVAQRDPAFFGTATVDGINKALTDINRQVLLDQQAARRMAAVRPMTYGEWSQEAPNFYDALLNMGVVNGQGVPYAEMAQVIASSGAEAQTRVLENFEMKAKLPQIREVRDQMLWSNTDEGMAAALALSSLILRLETTPYSGLVDMETNLPMELLDNLLLDPLNMLDLPFGAVANAHLAGKTLDAMTGLRTLDNADDLATLSRVFQDVYKPWMEGGRVGELVFPADVPADLLKLLPKANDLREPGNWFGRQLARTPETQVHIATNNLWMAMSNVLHGVDNTDDAIRLLRTLSNAPQELIKGVSGLTSPAFVRIADTDGIVRWGPGVISNPTFLREMPIFQAGTAKVVERMETARDEAMKAAKKAGTFYDGTQQRVNPLELMVNLNMEWEKAARQLRGTVPLEAPTGATRLNLHDLADGRAQVEWLDDEGKVISQFPARPIEEARQQLATLQDAVKPATENPIHKVFRVPAELQRHIMSDMWLNLRPAHWVRNAAAFTLALTTDGLYSFKSVPQMFEELGQKAIGGRMTQRLAEGASGAGTLGDMSGQHWTRKWWKNNNPVAWIAEHGSKAWTGYGQILGAIPVAEQAGYLKAYDSAFERLFNGDWATLTRQELKPLFDSWGVDPAVARAISDKIVETGKIGSKADVAQVARQITHGAAEPFSLQNLKIADGAIPVKEHKEIIGIVNALGRTTPGQAPETVQQAIQRAEQQIRGVFARLRTSPGAMLVEGLPQPTGERVVDALDDVAMMVDDALRDAGNAGITDPAQLAIIEEEAQQYAQKLVQGETVGWEGVLDELANAPDNPAGMVATFDLLSQVYELKRMARQEVDELLQPVRAAKTPAEKNAAWGAKFAGTKDIYTKLADDLQAVFEENKDILRRIAAGEEIPQQRDWWDVIARYLDFDERANLQTRGQDFGDMMQEDPAVVQKFIDANRAYVDSSYIQLYDIFRRYPSVDGLDVLRMAQKQLDAEGARAAAYLAIQRERIKHFDEAAQRIVGDLDKEDYYVIRNDTWRAMFDNQVIFNQAAARAIAAHALALDSPTKLTWTDEFFGGTFQLIGPAANDQMADAISFTVFDIFDTGAFDPATGKIADKYLSPKPAARVQQGQGKPKKGKAVWTITPEETETYFKALAVAGVAEKRADGWYLLIRNEDAAQQAIKERGKFAWLARNVETGEIQVFGSSNQMAPLSEGGSNARVPGDVMNDFGALVRGEPFAAKPAPTPAPPQAATPPAGIAPPASAFELRKQMAAGAPEAPPALAAQWQPAAEYDANRKLTGKYVRAFNSETGQVETGRVTSDNWQDLSYLDKPEDEMTPDEFQRMMEYNASEDGGDVESTRFGVQWDNGQKSYISDIDVRDYADAKPSPAPAAPDVTVAPENIIPPPPAPANIPTVPQEVLDAKAAQSNKTAWEELVDAEIEKATPIEERPADVPPDGMTQQDMIDRRAELDALRQADEAERSIAQEIVIDPDAVGDVAAPIAPAPQPVAPQPLAPPTPTRPEYPQAPPVTASTLNELAAGAGIATARADGAPTHRHLISVIRKDAKERNAGWQLPTTKIVRDGKVLDVTTDADFLRWVKEQPAQAEQAAEWLAVRVEKAAKLAAEPKPVKVAKAPKPKKGKAAAVAAPTPDPDIMPDVAQDVSFAPAAPAAPAPLPAPQIMEPAPPLPKVIQERMGSEGNAYMEARRNLPPGGSGAGYPSQAPFVDTGKPGRPYTPSPAAAPSPAGATATVERESAQQALDRVSASFAANQQRMAAQGPVAREELDRLALVRQWGDRWQYKTDINGRWYYANSEEGAVESATNTYRKLPADQRLTPAQLADQADAQRFAEWDARYGQQDLLTLKGMLDKAGGVRGVGADAEFTGNGGRRTGAAVANQGARDAGEFRLQMNIYLRERVRRAVDSGQPVPASVLADYPDLSPSFAAAPPTAPTPAAVAPTPAPPSPAPAQRAGFMATADPNRRARAEALLDAKPTRNAPQTRREMVEDAYRQGVQAEQRQGKLWYIGDRNVTTTEADYLNYLHASAGEYAPGVAPAAGVAQTPTTPAPRAAGEVAGAAPAAAPSPVRKVEELTPEAQAAESEVNFEIGVMVKNDRRYYDDLKARDAFAQKWRGNAATAQSALKGDIAQILKDVELGRLDRQTAQQIVDEATSAGFMPQLKREQWNTWANAAPSPATAPPASATPPAGAMTPEAPAAGAAGAETAPQPILLTYSADEIPYQLAKDAYSGTSWTPEKRALSDQQGYVEHMKNVVDEFAGYANADNTAEIAADLESYKQAYLKRYKALLHARSREISAWVSGPSKYPGRQQAKIMDHTDKLLNEFVEWDASALKRMRQSYNPKMVAKAPIKSGDADAIAKIQAKLTEAETLQQRMVDANKIVRSKKLTDEQKVQQLMAEINIPEKYARELLTPDFAGRIGFPDYATKNNGAEIRRLKERIAQIEKLGGTRGETTEWTFDGGRVVDNVEDDRVQIFYDARISPEDHQKMRESGFVYSRQNGAYQRQRMNARWAVLERTGVDIAPPAAAAPAEAAAAAPARAVPLPALEDEAPVLAGVEVAPGVAQPAPLKERDWVSDGSGTHGIVKKINGNRITVEYPRGNTRTFDRDMLVKIRPTRPGFVEYAESDEFRRSAELLQLKAQLKAIEDTPIELRPSYSRTDDIKARIRELEAQPSPAPAQAAPEPVTPGVMETPAGAAQAPAAPPTLLSAFMADPEIAQRLITYRPQFDMRPEAFDMMFDKWYDANARKLLEGTQIGEVLRQKRAAKEGLRDSIEQFYRQSDEAQAASDAITRAQDDAFRSQAATKIAEENAARQVARDRDEFYTAKTTTDWVSSVQGYAANTARYADAQTVKGFNRLVDQAQEQISASYKLQGWKQPTPKELKRMATERTQKDVARIQADIQRNLKELQDGYPWIADRFLPFADEVLTKYGVQNIERRVAKAAPSPAAVTPPAPRSAPAQPGPNAITVTAPVIDTPVRQVELGELAGLPLGTGEPMTAAGAGAGPAMPQTRDSFLRAYNGIDDQLEDLDRQRYIYGEIDHLDYLRRMDEIEQQRIDLLRSIGADGTDDPTEAAARAFPDWDKLLDRIGEPYRQLFREKMDGAEWSPSALLEEAFEAKDAISWREGWEGIKNAKGTKYTTSGYRFDLIDALLDFRREGDEYSSDKVASLLERAVWDEVLTPESVKAFWPALAKEMDEISTRRAAVIAEEAAEEAAYAAAVTAPTPPADVRQAWQMTPDEFDMASGVVKFWDIDRTVTPEITAYRLISKTDELTWLQGALDDSFYGTPARKKAANAALDSIGAQRKMRGGTWKGGELVNPHKFVVQRALEQGKPVPPDVLARYPDLAAKMPRTAAPNADFTSDFPGAADRAKALWPNRGNVWDVSERDFLEMAIRKQLRTDQFLAIQKQAEDLVDSLTTQQNAAEAAGKTRQASSLYKKLQAALTERDRVRRMLPDDLVRRVDWKELKAAQDDILRRMWAEAVIDANQRGVATLGIPPQWVDRAAEIVGYSPGVNRATPSPAPTIAQPAVAATPQTAPGIVLKTTAGDLEAQFANRMTNGLKRRGDNYVAIVPVYDNDGELIAQVELLRRPEDAGWWTDRSNITNRGGPDVPERVMQALTDAAILKPRTAAPPPFKLADASTGQRVVNSYNGKVYEVAGAENGIVNLRDVRTGENIVELPESTKFAPAPQAAPPAPAPPRAAAGERLPTYVDETGTTVVVMPTVTPEEKAATFVNNLREKYKVEVDDAQVLEWQQALAAADTQLEALRDKRRALFDAKIKAREPQEIDAIGKQVAAIDQEMAPIQATITEAQAEISDIFTIAYYNQRNARLRATPPRERVLAELEYAAEHRTTKSDKSLAKFDIPAAIKRIKDNPEIPVVELTVPVPGNTATDVLGKAEQDAIKAQLKEAEALLSSNRASAVTIHYGRWHMTVIDPVQAQELAKGLGTRLSASIPEHSGVTGARTGGFASIVDNATERPTAFEPEIEIWENAIPMQGRAMAPHTTILENVARKYKMGKVDADRAFTGMVDGQPWYTDGYAAFSYKPKEWAGVTPKPTTNSDATAQIVKDATTNTVAIEPLGLVGNNSKAAGGFPGIVFGTDDGRVKGMNAKYYAGVMQAANGKPVTWVTPNRPHRPIVAMVDGKPFAVIMPYAFNQSDLPKIAKYFYPQNEPGYLTMYGGFGAVDPVPAMREIYQTMLRYWRKPKQPEIGDVALHQVTTLNDAEDRILAALPGLAQPRRNNLTAAQANALIDTIDKRLLPAFDDAVSRAGYGAQKMADTAMLNYRDRRGFDANLALFLPYHYFYTRGGLTWLRRMARKPSTANMYFDVQKAIETENQQAGVPSRFKGTIPLWSYPGGQIRMANPLNSMMPFYMYMPDPFQTQEGDTDVERMWTALKNIAPGVLPSYDVAMAAMLDQIDPLPNGDSRVARYTNLRNYVPLTGTGADTALALTGTVTPPNLGGDPFDSYRVKRQAALMAQQGALNDEMARYVIQLSVNLDGGGDAWANIPDDKIAAVRAAYIEAGKLAGRDKLLMGAGAGYLLGANLYNYTDAEGELASAQALWRYSGYGAANPSGSAAQRQAVMAQTPALGAYMARSTQPGSPYQPGQQAQAGALYDQLDPLYAQQAAIEDKLITESGGAVSGAALNNATAQIRKEADALRAQYPDIPAPSGRPGSGSNPAELAEWMLRQAVPKGGPTYPGEGASKAELAAYYDARGAWEKEQLATFQRNLTTIIAGGDPMQDEINFELFGMMAGKDAATLLREYGSGYYDSPTKRAYDTRNDVKNREESARFDAAEALILQEFGPAGLDVYRTYTITEEADREAYKAAHPELRALNFAAYNPNEYGSAVALFGKDAILQWASLPPSDGSEAASKARAAYYDANPGAYLMNAWMNGRPTPYGETRGPWASLPEEWGMSYQANYGKDFAEASGKFGADIWQIAAGYKRGWTSKEKAAYFDKYPQLGDFFDWWNELLPDDGKSSGSGKSYRSYKSYYKKKYYPRRSYSRRSYGGYSSGGWGSGGYQKEERAPWIDDVYARDFDRNLWRTEGALRRWEAPRTDDSLAERWRPARYG